MVDSTGLAQRCDPEDVQDVLFEFQTLSTRCVESWGGQVINYRGDGILAQFGYPLASEHEAEAAVRAGLDLVTTIGALRVRTAAGGSEPIRVRIGIHTGVAVIGKAAAGHVHDATEIVGDTPNIAARLQALGDPDCVLISGETEHLLRGKFRLHPLGSHALRGVSRDVQVFRVVEEASEDDLLRGPQRRAIPLVNRTAELAELLDAWELAKRGQGQAVEITGEAGIGKSRLALELVERSGLSENVVLVVHGSAHHQNVPFYPVIKRLEQRIGIRRDEAASNNVERLRDFLDCLRQFREEAEWLIGNLLGLPLPAPPSLAALDPQEVRRRTRECLVLVLVSCFGGPGLLFVEDIHWVDPSTREVVDRVLAGIAGSPILLLITSRTGTSPNFKFSEGMRRIVLRRLDEEQSRDLAVSAMRDRQLPPQLFDRVVARSDGIPLFIEELAAAALETGQVDGERTGAPSLDPDHVPSALHDPLMTRLDALGEAKQVVLLAAAMGRSFSRRLLATVSEADHSTLEAALAQLVDSDLVRLERHDPEPTYAFKHALVRDVAYQSLLRRQRRELHARIAQTIEARLPEFAAAEPDYLAQHLSEAGLAARAARMWLEAAAQSARRSANLEAVAQLRTALKEIDNLPAGRERDELELSVQLALIGPSIASRGYAALEAAQASDRALELCRALCDPARMFPALYARWSYSRVTGNIHEARKLAEDFLALAEESGNRASRMVGHRLLGTALIAVGEVETAHRHLEQALLLHDPATDRADALAYGADVQVTTLCNLSIACWHLGRITAASAHRQRAAELALETRDANTLGYAFSHICMLDTLERDVEAVRNRASEVLAAAIERELPFWATVARVFLGWCEVQSGRLEAGIDMLESQRRALESARNVYWKPTFLCWLAEAYCGSGDTAQAVACLAEARDNIAWGGQTLYESECWRIEGLIAAHASAGDPARAEHCLERAFLLARDRGQRSFALRAAKDLATFLVQRQRRAAARRLLQQAMRGFAQEPDRADRADVQSLLSSLRGIRMSEPAEIRERRPRTFP